MNDLILTPDAVGQMMAIAKAMAGASVTVPNHLRNNAGDCLAIVMQASQWGISPFAVAQKTHLSQGGALGYEAQLISAVVAHSGALATVPDYEFFGDWDKILGKIVEKTGAEKNGKPGGKYYVQGWSPADEKGLGVICRAVLVGEKEPRSITVLLTQCQPRFSTQWATDPQQQITYAAIRKWSRRFSPGAILGIYTPEELAAPAEIDMGQAERIPPGRPEIGAYPADQFEANRAKWREAIASGRRTPEQIIGMVETKGILSEAQKEAIRAFAPPTPPAERPPIDAEWTAAYERTEGAEQ